MAKRECLKKRSLLQRRALIHKSVDDFLPRCVWNNYRPPERRYERRSVVEMRPLRTLMENKFERPRVQDARCFECLPNLRGDVRYKERRPVRRRHRGTKWHSRRKLKGRFSIAHLVQSIFQRFARLSSEVKSQLRALHTDNGSFIPRQKDSRVSCGIHMRWLLSIAWFLNFTIYEKKCDRFTVQLNDKKSQS